jgi:hypothetical protein
MTLDYAAVFRETAAGTRPAEVFAAARRGPVLIEQSGGENLVVETEQTAKHRKRVADEAARVLALGRTPPAEFPSLPGFAWSEALDIPDRQEMAAALADALRRAVETGIWDEYDLAWFGWHESASALSDPELAARLLEDADPKQSVFLTRP